MSKLMWRLGVGVLLLSGSGCTTMFFGAPKVGGGAAECRARCDEQGLEFAGMVMMGYYTDGCICRERGARADATLEQGAADAVGGAVASMTDQQRRRNRD